MAHTPINMQKSYLIATSTQRNAHTLVPFAFFPPSASPLESIHVKLSFERGNPARMMLLIWVLTSWSQMSACIRQAWHTAWPSCQVTFFFLIKKNIPEISFHCQAISPSYCFAQFHVALSHLLASPGLSQCLNLLVNTFYFILIELRPYRLLFIYH